MRIKRKIITLLLFLLVLGIPIGLYAVSNIMLSQVGRPLYTLTVTGSGTGTGVITSNLYGINCTSTGGVESGICSVQIPAGTTIVLTATPDAGQMFNGWTGSGCSGTGTCTIIVLGNMTVDAEFLNIPSASMVGWFKHNEGSGTTIIDYSSVAANGILVSDGAGGPIPTPAELNFFWNTNLGFGTGTNNTNFDCRTLRSGPPINTTYASILAFIKPTGDGVFNPQQAVQLGEGGGNFIIVGYRFAVPHFWIIGLPTGNYQAAVEAATFGTWYCIYAFNQRNTNNTGMYIRKSGDADWTLARGGDPSGAVGVIQNGLYMFGGTNNTLQVVGGDSLYYADLASTGIVTLTQATNIYNSLKARYGML